VLALAVAVALPIVIHVTGAASGGTAPGCFLSIPGRIAGGGTSTYCLRTFRGAPGPDAVVRDRGTITFRLPDGTITAEVAIVQRFAPDGRRARQALTGTVTGGTGSYSGLKGTITGSGTDTETAPGRLTASDLTYRISAT
jgi:hypothetical protein